MKEKEGGSEKGGKEGNQKHHHGKPLLFRDEMDALTLEELRRQFREHLEQVFEKRRK